MSRERFQARSKKVQKLGRDGLVEQDRASGEEQRVSQRTADVSFGRERPAERDTAQNSKERGKKARLRAQIAEYQQQIAPMDAPERTEAPNAPEVSEPGPIGMERAADDTPPVRVPSDDGKARAARHKWQVKAAARQRDAPCRLSFEQPENGALRFEPERGAEHESSQPEKEPHDEARRIPRQAEKPLTRAPRRKVGPRSSAERGQETQVGRHQPKQKERYQADAPRRLSFEQPKDSVMQFEPSRSVEAEQKRPEEPAYSEDTTEETLQAAQTVDVPFARDAEGNPTPRDAEGRHLPRAADGKTAPRNPPGGTKLQPARCAMREARRHREPESRQAPAPVNPKAAKQRQAMQHTPEAAAPQRHRLRFEDAAQRPPDSSAAPPSQQKRYNSAPAVKADQAAPVVQSGHAVVRPCVGDAEKPRRRLRFEEEAPKETRAPLSPVRKAALTAALTAAHGKAQEAEDGNVAVEAAHEGEIVTERGTGTLLRHRRSRRQSVRFARAARRTERQIEQAVKQEHPQVHSNPISRQQQKRAIARKYAAAKRERTQKAASTAGRRAAKAAERAKKETIDFVRRHRKGVLLIGAFAFVVMMCSSLLTSCSMFFQGGTSAITSATTYPSEDADMLAAEAWYAAKEAELQAYLDTYEDTHAYNEYHYELDDIEHDPYVLISILTALRGGAWTIDEVQDTLQMLFDRQYILTETVTSETRTRTVDGAEQQYTYYKCTVTLKNENLSHLPVYIMSEEQLSMYATYMGTLGNRPDLFPTSGYINKYLVQGYTDYEIPASALEDETFAAMIAEAEKYLGYPYVWGGSNPNTSFDCSGFVSWVINHSGWNVGRLGAQSLYNICTPTNSPRPGDLIFFTGTFAADTPVTHVGIYVGDGWMIHAGDPISYASVNSNYFRAHFYAYGRLP